DEVGVVGYRDADDLEAIEVGVELVLELVVGELGQAHGAGTGWTVGDLGHGGEQVAGLGGLDDLASGVLALELARPADGAAAEVAGHPQRVGRRNGPGKNADP